jgi:organic hydroperoxide reductase OsmC/OhrA
MSTHHASVRWTRSTPDFEYATYVRAHTTSFGSGQSLDTSSAPEFAGDPTRTNPEELLVGALSSCHMLTFLAVAARKRFVVDSYEDQAEGVLEKDASGVMWVTRVVLRPVVHFSGTAPDAAQLAALHESAHRNCFIANSVKTEVRVEPQA